MEICQRVPLHKTGNTNISLVQFSGDVSWSLSRHRSDHEFIPLLETMSYSTSREASITITHLEDAKEKILLFQEEYNSFRPLRTSSVKYETAQLEVATK